MYEIKIPLFPLIFFKFHDLKNKNFDFLNEKYSVEFMALSYLKNQEITNFNEIKKIFPQLISKNSDYISDEEFKVLGIFPYYFENKYIRLALIIQESNKNFNFRLKMKKKSEKDFYETILNKKDMIDDLKNNIIEEFFANFIKI